MAKEQVKKEKVVLADNERQAILKQYGAMQFLTDDLNKLLLPSLPEEIKKEFGIKE